MGCRPRRQLLANAASRGAAHVLRYAAKGRLIRRVDYSSSFRSGWTCCCWCIVGATSCAKRSQTRAISRRDVRLLLPAGRVFAIL